MKQALVPADGIDVKKAKRGRRVKNRERERD
jgi:hypothetical protein